MRRGQSIPFAGHQLPVRTQRPGDDCKVPLLQNLPRSRSGTQPVSKTGADENPRVSYKRVCCRRSFDIAKPTQMCLRRQAGSAPFGRTRLTGGGHDRDPVVCDSAPNDDATAYPHPAAVLRLDVVDPATPLGCVRDGAGGVVVGLHGRIGLRRRSGGTDRHELGTRFFGKGFARARDRAAVCPDYRPSPVAETGNAALARA